jgi:hypothetical protein
MNRGQLYDGLNNLISGLIFPSSEDKINPVDTIGGFQMGVKESNNNNVLYPYPTINKKTKLISDWKMRFIIKRLKN